MPKGSKATGGGAPKSSGKFNDKRGIDALKGYVGQPLQPNRFIFQFLTLPKDFELPDGDTLSILCQSATLPGKSIETAEHIRHRYMPTGDVDYGQSISLTYICDTSFMDRYIIEEWLRYVHSADVDTWTDISYGKSSDGEKQIFRFYDEYAAPCKAQCHVLRRDGSAAMTYTFHDVYPQGIDDISLEMSSNDEVMQFSFDLGYKWWTVEYLPIETEVKMNQPMDGNFEISGLNKGRKIFDAVLEGLKVAGRFNKKAGAMGRRLGQLDTAITRGSNISRDIGGSFNSNYVTNKRRGGG